VNPKWSDITSPGRLTFWGGYADLQDLLDAEPVDIERMLVTWVDPWVVEDDVKIRHWDDVNSCVVDCVLKNVRHHICHKAKPIDTLANPWIKGTANHSIGTLEILTTTCKTGDLLGCRFHLPSFLSQVSIEALPGHILRFKNCLRRSRKNWAVRLFLTGERCEF